MRRMLLAAAVTLGLFSTASVLCADPPHVSRGGIAVNDFGHGPSGGRPSAPNQGAPGSHVHPHGHGGNRIGGHWHQGGGYWNNNHLRYHDHWGGWGWSRPWLFSGSGISLSVGSPYGYSSFGYYNGPWVGNFYDYLRPTGYSSVSIIGPNFIEPYGTYYSPRDNSVSYFLPPTYVPAELAYGPLAVKQFMGVDRNFGLGPLRLDPAPLDLPRGAAKPLVEPPARPVVREIDWEARKQADRYLELGDKYFQEQKFYDALLRYRLALKADANYPIARLKLGFALVTNRRFDEATAEFVEAVKLDPQIIKSGFRIDQLYADNRLAREGHEEMIAQQALNHPEDGNIHFVVGMWLLFHGEAERSRAFFAEAKRLGVDGELVASAEERAREL